MAARVYQLRFSSKLAWASTEKNSANSAWLREGRYQDVVSGLGSKSGNLTALEENTVGVAHFMLGHPRKSIPHFHRILKRPFSKAHLSAAKNLKWVYMSLNSPKLSSAENMLEKVLRKSVQAGIRPKGFSFYDLPMQRAICSDPMYTRNRESEEWSGVDRARRWRLQYFDLLKKSLTNYIYRDIDDWGKQYMTESKDPKVCATGACESEWDPNQGAAGFIGSEVPAQGHSVMRLGSLNHIQLVIEDVMNKGVTGDVIEAGCYRGGTGVLMRAVLDEDQDKRTVWVADSFQGIPMPASEKGKAVDETKDWSARYDVSQPKVEGVFRRYGFGGHRVQFLPGFFNESLRSPTLSQASFSVIHIDVDSYDSVLDVLKALYPKLSPGGYVVIDDIHLFGVREAINEYRNAHGITAPLLPVPSDFTSTCQTDLAAGGGINGGLPKHIDLVTAQSAAYWVTDRN